MKQKLLFFTLLFISIVAFPQAPTTNTFTDGDYSYKITSENPKNVEITKYSGSGDFITIPVTANGYSVTSIGDYAFYNKKLISVTIPASVTSIGDYAFGYTKLISVIISASVTSIGDYAFVGSPLIRVTSKNTNPKELLTNVFSNNSIANGWTSYRDKITLIIPAETTAKYETAKWTGFKEVIEVFTEGDYSYKITSTTAPKTVEITRYLGNGGEIEIPTIANGYTITSIGKLAFYQNKLTSVTIPANVTSIGPSAFAINQLTSVTIPASITSIGDFAFAMNQLTSITIPASVINIGDKAFADNINLTAVISKSTDPKYLNYFVFSYGYGDNYKQDKANITLTIPAGTTANYTAKGWTGFKEVKEDPLFKVGDYSYKITSATDPKTVEITGYSGSENKIEIPATSNGYSVTSIGEKAFFQKNLTSVTIPANVTSIGRSAFYDNQLTSVSIPNSVTSIGDYVFYGNKLTSVTIPASVTSIGEGAFGYTRLISVTIPASVTSIGSYAFAGNTNLTAVTSKITNPSELLENVFSSKDKITLTIPVGTTAKYTTANWTGFKEVKENPLFTDGDYSYKITSSNPKTVEITEYLGSQTVIEIPATANGYSVTSIGESVFYEKNLTSVTIPNNVTSIGKSAFRDNQLTSVTIPDSVTSIGDYAFYQNKLTSVTIPNSVTSIGDYAFKNNQLTSVTISTSVTNIGDYAFSSNQLTSVIIPNSVTSIGDYAFYQNKLTSVTIPNSVKSIGVQAFAYNQLTSVTIPNSVTTIGGSTFYNNKLTTVTIPASVTSIGVQAFQDNQLTSVTIPNSVTSIGDYAFQDNQLTSVTIPASVTSIGRTAFYGNKLINITISEGVTSISDYAFAGNPNLTEVISKSTDPATISATVFSNKANITLTIPAGTTANYTAKGWIGFKSVTELVPLTTIPDANFEAYLEANGYGNGIANDKKVLTNKIKSLTSINVDRKEITDLTGIEDFTSLRSLRAYYNKFTSLDLSKNLELANLEIGGNKELVTLNVSKNTKLLNIDSFDTKLTNLDVSKNTKLFALRLSGNNLESLDVSNNTELTNLSFSGTISVIDISKNIELTYLYIKNTKLTTINTSNNTKLTSISIDNAPLESISMSEGAVLKSLSFVDTKLTAIDISKYIGLKSITVKNTLLTSLDVSKNIELKSITVKNTLLTSLDVSKNTVLESLSIENSKFTALDVSMNTGLKTLYANNNKLTSLDVSKNTVLESCILNDNNLTSLNIKNGNNSKLLYFRSYNNPKLKCILVDDTANIPSGWLKQSTASYNSVDCTDPLFTDGDYSYKITSATDPKTVEIVKYIGKTKTEIKDNDISEVTYLDVKYTVTSIGEKAFIENPLLTSVTIPASVKTIGNGAFGACEKLTTLTFSENSKLTSIGEKSFAKNPLLTSVTIPASVTSIGDFAFFRNPKLTTIKFDTDSKLTTIGKGAFALNPLLTSVKIPASVTTIGVKAFLGNPKLTTLEFAENSKLTTISEGAFIKCALTSVTIPASVTSIEERVFYENKLTTVTIPNSVTSIGEGAFANNPLTAVISKMTNPSELLTNVFNLYDEDEDTWANNKANITLTIPAGTVTKYETAKWTGFKAIESNRWEGNNSSDWNTANNWTTKTVPTADDAITIPANLENYPTANNAISFKSLTIENGASFIAKSTVTGKIIHKQNISDKWHLVSSPVAGENIKNLIENHTFASGTNGNIGIGNYANTTGNPAWNYEKTATASTNPIKSGLGLSIKLAKAGTLSFTGTANISDVTIAISKGTRSKFNLIGNPFMAYLNSKTFTNSNTNLLSEETIWVWNGTSYETYNKNTPLDIAPGKAFFVSAKTDGSITFKTANQIHKTVRFARQSAKPSFELFVENKASKKSTRVFYVNNKTTGFDNGYDSSMFTDTASNFDVFTELISENKGTKLAIQTLPTSKIEEMIIPVGLTAKSGKEVTFSVNAQNLPTDVKIYLEDRKTNTFTNISEKSHKIVLENQAKGTGQFYIHTTSKNLEIASIPENLQEDLQKINIFKSVNNSLTITGLQNENASVNVFSMLGKKVISKKIKATGVSVIQLPKTAKGVYIVELISNSEKITKKIILE
ncbi:leucine-rich repeat protein [Tenacibaculum finnmarkense]|uniref:leucine-rich repeat protein n=1 Tax=Tenacibaculum finnmarkense TaxID=2781243 RepID=UPI001EFB3C19|nr:leucine-rich repeat protein [Tenacibaculum finnmarkense]MCG8882225.1 leucine-rich repeat protein [Tenacibaculum finnmarkense]